MYWRTDDVSANDPSMTFPGRYIGGTGINAPPTIGLVFVVKFHSKRPTAPALGKDGAVEEPVARM